MELLRALVLVLLKQNIIFRSVHIPGVNNMCDHLSRCQVVARFLRQHGLDALELPTPVPATICPSNLKP